MFSLCFFFLFSILRDIKPANFLLHTSGHLKICDFATAAPFSHFDAQTSGQSTRPQKRLVHHMFCEKPAGTCDYIAPEILLHEEAKLAGANGTFPSMAGADASTDASVSATYNNSASCTFTPHSDPTPPQGPGAYGPEVDWWSVGVVLYEMTYGSLPFWASSLAEAWYRIKNHGQFFRLDPQVPISSELRSLLLGLLSSAPHRLGRQGSDEVLSHPVFAGSDPASWASEPPPFVPTVDDSLLLPDDSCMLSQTSVSREEVMGPLFPDSFEQSGAGDCLSISLLDPAAMAQSNSGQGPAAPPKETLDQPMDHPMEGVDAVADTSMESCPMTDAEADDEHDPLELADYAWIGFTHQPAGHCFDGARARAMQARSQAAVQAPPMLEQTVATPSQESIWTPAAPAVASFRKGGLGPLISTPFVRPDPSTYGEGPQLFHSSTPALGMTSILNGSSLVSRQAAERYSTPARPGMPMATGSVPPNSGGLVPPSPYPFPQVAPLMPTPARPPSSTRAAGGRRLPPMLAPGGWNASMSTDSHSRTTVGSDTRCSGGSNAKREVSESQAWSEMMKAVHQSARKRRQGQIWTPAGSSSFVQPTQSAAGRRPLAFARHQARRQQQHLGAPDKNVPSSIFGKPHVSFARGDRGNNRRPSRSPSLPSDDEDDELAELCSRVSPRKQLLNSAQRRAALTSCFQPNAHHSSPHSQQGSPTKTGTTDQDEDMQGLAFPMEDDVHRCTGVSAEAQSASIPVLLAEDLASSEPDTASDEEEDWISASPSAARTRSTRPGHRPGTALARLTSSSDEASCQPSPARGLTTEARREQPGISSSVEELHDESATSPRSWAADSQMPRPSRCNRRESRGGLPIPRRLFTKTTSMPIVPRLPTSSGHLSPASTGSGTSLDPIVSSHLRPSSSGSEGRVSPVPMPFVGRRGLARSQSEAVPLRRASSSSTAQTQNESAASDGPRVGLGTSTAPTSLRSNQSNKTSAIGKPISYPSSSQRPGLPWKKDSRHEGPRSTRLASERNSRSVSHGALDPPSVTETSDPDESLSFTSAWAASRAATIQTGETDAMPPPLLSFTFATDDTPVDAPSGPPPSPPNAKQMNITPSPPHRDPSPASAPASAWSPGALHMNNLPQDHYSPGQPGQWATPGPGLPVQANGATPLSALYERTAREIHLHGQVFAGLRQRLKDVHLSAAQWASELSP